MTNHQQQLDARTMIADYLERFSRDVSQASGVDIHFEPLDNEGYTSVARGSATVGINVLSEHGILLLLCTISPLPRNGAERIFRKLLELNYLDTSDAAFAIDKRSETLVLRSLRRLAGLDYEEFADLLNTVAAVADALDDQIREMAK